MAKSYYIAFLKDNIIVIFGAALLRLQGLIFIPIVVKASGATVYGGFALVMSILSIAIGVSSSGAGFRAHRFLPSAKTMMERRNLFYPQFLFNLLTVIGISVILILWMGQINRHLFKSEVELSFWIAPFYLIANILYSQGLDYFRYTGRIICMRLAGVGFSYFHVLLILIYLYWYKSVSVSILILSSCVSAVVVSLPCYFFILREIGTKVTFYKKKDLFSDIRLGFPIVIGLIIDFILVASDRFFIAFYMSVGDVGNYASAYALGSIVGFIPKSMGTALPQLISKAVDNKNEYEAQMMLNYAIKIFILVAIPFIFGSIALGKPILTLLANKEVAENAYLITPIVALGTLFYGLNIILSNILFVRMKTYSMFKMNLFASVFSLLANLILLYFFKNIIVAAITTFLSYFLAFIYINNILKKESWPVYFHFPIVIKSMMASLFMIVALFGFSAWLSESVTVSMLIVELILGVVVYFIVLFTIGTFSKNELQFVKSCVFR